MAVVVNTFGLEITVNTVLILRVIFVSPLRDRLVDEVLRVDVAVDASPYLN
jgi:Na+-translocating ferredoxin:NAD+ oxidoreductase RnfE subunit